MPINWQQLTHGIEAATAASAAEFIEALRPSNAHWWEGNTCPWVFRGHAREEWSLLPSAWRPKNPIIANSTLEAERRFDAVRPTQSLHWFFPPNFVSGTAVFDANDNELARRLTIATASEYLPLWEFAAGCDELGMPVPLAGPGPDPAQDPNWLPDPNAPLLGDELFRFSDLPAALALAQHHGIPTRLLDWTSNPMAAAYFAVEPLRAPQQGANLVVWAIHKGHARDVTIQGADFPNCPGGITRRIDSTISIVRPSTRDNPFLAAQSGLFTSFWRSGIYFLRSGGIRPSIEAFVEQAKPVVTVLRKLVLRHEHAPELIETLRREKISRSALMPTMDNVAQDVLTKWEQWKVAP